MWKQKNYLVFEHAFVMVPTFFERNLHYVLRGIMLEWACHMFTKQWREHENFEPFVKVSRIEWNTSKVEYTSCILYFTFEYTLLSSILHIISLLTGDMNSINWPRSLCVASSVDRASHRYRGGHKNPVEALIFSGYNCSSNRWIISCILHIIKINCVVLSRVVYQFVFLAIQPFLNYFIYFVTDVLKHIY